MDAQELTKAVTDLNENAKPREKADRAAVTVPSEELAGFMRKLHENSKLSFDMLSAHTAVDWAAENRFELIYQLYSTKHGHYLMVSTSVPRENPTVASVSSIWRIAEWQEREVYEMFGVLYSDHPDLRRMILDDNWQGFPLRKDYKDDFMVERPQ